MPGIVLKGVGFGAALAMWQSIDSHGLAWTLLRWAAVTALLGVGIALLRQALTIIVLRYRFAAGPPDRMIFVGDPESERGRYAAEALSRRPGIFSLGWLSEQAGAGDYLGHPSAVWEVLCETRTDTVVFCEELAPELFDTLIEAAAVAGCRVLSVRTRGTLLASQPRAVNGPELRMLELTFPAARAGQDVVKRALDLVVASALLVLLSPLLVALSVWVKLDSEGPILFIQDRVGQAGTRFPMIKFRTMTADADRQKSGLAHLNPSGDPRLFKIPNDPRVTRAGAFLRRWSLDELPQLFNVAWGHMSLVGPRPFFQADLAAYDDHHFIRLSVKPGVTGLWQVKGRSSILDFEEVVDLDREYIENWSIWSDVSILAATLPAVVRRTGAY
jgi:exopolysaccharide biosynthesis polyprenyl glycosylphosphotransferase